MSNKMPNTEHEEMDVGREITNNTLKGATSRTFSYEERPDFVSYLEIEALLMERMKQIDNPLSPHNQIHSKIVEKHGSGANVMLMCLAELADKTITYPLCIMHGDRQLVIHKDLKVHRGMINIIVAKTADGSVSFDDTKEFIEAGIPSETALVENETEQVSALRANMAKNSF